MCVFFFFYIFTAKSCYQCAYSPPKTYYDKKVRVESVKYGKHYGHKNEAGYGKGQESYGSKHGGYTKKTYIPVPYTINVRNRISHSQLY